MCGIILYLSAETHGKDSSLNAAVDGNAILYRFVYCSGTERVLKLRPARPPRTRQLLMHCSAVVPVHGTPFHYWSIGNCRYSGHCTYSGIKCKCCRYSDYCTHSDHCTYSELFTEHACEVCCIFLLYCNTQGILNRSPTSKQKGSAQKASGEDSQPGEIWTHPFSRDAPRIGHFHLD